MAGKFYFLFDADFLVIDSFNLEILMLPVEEKRGIRMSLPTDEQLIIAQEVADKLCKRIDPDWLKDSLKLSMWTKSNRGKVMELFRRDK